MCYGSNDVASMKNTAFFADSRALNLQDRKMKNKEISGVENAGLEKNGQKCRAGKCKTGVENDEQHCRGWKMQDYSTRIFGMFPWTRLLMLWLRGAKTLR